MDTISALRDWAAAAADAAALGAPPSPVVVLSVAFVAATAGWAAAVLHTRLWNRAFAVTLWHHAVCAVAAVATFAAAAALPFVGYGHDVATGAGDALDAEWARATGALSASAEAGAVRDFERRLVDSRPGLAQLVAHAQRAPSEAAGATYATLRARVIDGPARVLTTLFWAGLGLTAVAQITAFSALAWSARRELD